MSPANNSTIWIAIWSLNRASSVAANNDVSMVPPATFTCVSSLANSLSARH